MSVINPDHLREISRRVASLIIFSSDGKMLMGRRAPGSGGVYPDSWHIPGGGTEEGEELEDTAIREGAEEAVGLHLTKDMLKKLPGVFYGATEKTLKTGEKVWCNMEFNHFEAHLNKPAAELATELTPGDDLAELRWFSRQELPGLQLIPGSQAFFIEAGYMDAPTQS